MKHAIEILEAELNREDNEKEDEDSPFALHDAIKSFRKSTDLKLAIRMLRQWVKDAEEISNCKY